MNKGAVPRTAAPRHRNKGRAGRPQPQERRLVFGAIVAAVVGVLLVSAITLAYLRSQAEARVAATTQNLSKSLVLTFDGLLDAIDVAIQASGDEIARQDASGHPDQQQINRFLTVQQQRLPVMPYLRATNANGDVIHGTGVLTPSVNVLGRPYFSALRDRPSAGLYISPPGIGKISQTWVWQFARRYNKPDGSFGGIVYGVLAIDQIQKLIGQIKLDEGGSIVLRHAGFEAVAARMGADADYRIRVGDTTLSPELQAALRQDPAHGTYATSSSVLTASAHTFSYERSSKYGFYVWVGEANQMGMADWYRQMWIISGLALAFSLLAFGFLRLMNKGWRRQARDLYAIRRLAYYDALTELPNRRLMLDRLAAAMKGNGARGRHGALLLIDLDHFKLLNDTHGHERGDLLLRQVAGRLQACVGSSDTVARIGGDEFVVLVWDLPGDVDAARLQAAALGEKVHRTLCASFDLDGFQHATSPSVGITLFAGRELGVEELLKRADTAMYQAKAAGRNTVRFFDPAMQAAVAERMALESDLRDALALGQFLLHYQAQVDALGCIKGAEVLLRWQHPVRGLVSPAQFIPLAEATGLICPIGLWVLETACAQLAAWSRDPSTSALSLAVNVSACQFNQADFVDQVLEVLARSGANPARLKLELTEGLLLDNTEAVIATIGALKKVRVRFSLDDFGTGYSSLSYLKRLPLDQLKIDQSFVRDLLTDANDIAIVRTIVALGQSLGMEVIAEGVETAAQRDCLASAGCHAYQGYYFGRPLPVAQLEQALHRQMAEATEMAQALIAD
jgi:diguanylate cyclase (GGDEF)-like protein